MAAGLGTRMRLRLPKELHPICGRPMLACVIDAACEAPATDPVWAGWSRNKGISACDMSAPGVGRCLFSHLLLEFARSAPFG